MWKIVNKYFSRKSLLLLLTWEVVPKKDVLPKKTAVQDEYHEIVRHMLESLPGFEEPFSNGSPGQVGLFLNRTIKTQ